MAHPKIGNIAPAFNLLNQAGEQVSLKTFKGDKQVVLYFYPKAMTPGCTVQAHGLRDSKKALAKLDAVTLGISPDTVKRLDKFCLRDELNFDLLSDLAAVDGEAPAIADKYGVWQLKKFMGKEYMGIVRTTFIIGKDGRLKAVLDKFKTKNHHQVVLDYLAQNP